MRMAVGLILRALARRPITALLALPFSGCADTVTFRAPSNSPTIRDRDAPGTTFKRRSLDRDSRATLCVISNSEPFNFVSVEGRVEVETNNLIETTRKVFIGIADTGYNEPDDLEAWLESQERVILRLKPERVTGVIR